MYLSRACPIACSPSRLGGDERGVNVLLAVPWLREEQDLVTHSSFGPSLFRPIYFLTSCVCVYYTIIGDAIQTCLYLKPSDHRAHTTCRRWMWSGQCRRSWAPAASALGFPWNPVVHHRLLLVFFPLSCQFSGSPGGFSTVVTEGALLQRLFRSPAPGGPRAGQFPAPGSGAQSTPAACSLGDGFRDRPSFWPRKNVPDVLPLVLVSPWDLAGSLVSSPAFLPQVGSDPATCSKLRGCLLLTSGRGGCDPETSCSIHFWGFLIPFHFHFQTCPQTLITSFPPHWNWYLIYSEDGKKAKTPSAFVDSPRWEGANLHDPTPSSKACGEDGLDYISVVYAQWVLLVKFRMRREGSQLFLLCDEIGPNWTGKFVQDFFCSENVVMGFEVMSQSCPSTSTFPSVMKKNRGEMFLVGAVWLLADSLVCLQMWNSGNSIPCVWI